LAKVKTAFFCTNCGASAPRWQGQCPSCKEWNTLVEEVIAKETKEDSIKKLWRGKNEKKSVSTPKKLSEIQKTALFRLKTPDNEFNRILGGGIVPGSLVLIGGEPGIGKSTLMLQVALNIREKVLYVSGEESEQQIKMRATRILDKPSDCYILSETNTENIFRQANELLPALIVVDSIQTLSSPLIESMPGSVSQIRECAGELQRYAKENNIPIVLIGHITKEGGIAGPKLLEHIVDTVLQFEGDRHHTYRILRSLKNRFGSTDELGIYEMQATGLREVSNPSELLLSQKEEDLSGSAIAATLEGMRPLLIETQALVTRAVYGNPQRSATGFDLRRLSMLLAVLEKRGNFPFGLNDVFLNIAGGIRIEDPALDLAIISSLISSLENVAIPSKYCFAGEVGLSGEIRAVNRIEQRIQEADRLGFEVMFISKYNLKGLDLSKYHLKVVAFAKVEELYERLFG